MRSTSFRRSAGLVFVLVTIAVAGSVPGFLLGTLPGASVGSRGHLSSIGIPSAPVTLAPRATVAVPAIETGPARTCPNGVCSPTAKGAPAPAASSAYWTNLSSPASPPWTVNAAMTFDTGSQSVLLFGVNASGGGEFGDRTWEFSQGTWTDVSATAGLPPNQAGQAMTYDGHDGYVLLFGCPTDALTGPPDFLCNDTWQFSGGMWHQVAAINPPSENDVVGAYGQLGPLSLVYDAKDSYSMLTNGVNTWTYVGGSWTALCRVPGNCGSGYIPAPNLFGTATYDAHDGYVLFVGVNETGGTTVGGGSWTWKFVNGQWSNISASVGTSPSPRMGAMMTYDSSTSSAILFGGLRCIGLGCTSVKLNDTWSFQSGAWQNVTAGLAPPARFAGQISDDPRDSEVILFSGAETIQSRSGDTWGWGTAPPISGLSISYFPVAPAPGASVYFNNSFSGGVSPFTYSWTFGDGGSSTLPSPIHVFHSDGRYPVNLWVNDSVGHSAHTSTQVYAYLPLSVTTLQAAPNPAILGEPVNFSTTVAGGTPPFTYAWVFGDGGVGGNLSNITHIYTTNGPFEAVVTVTDPAGGFAQAPLNISIKLQALAAASTSSGGSPLTVSFVGGAQGGSPPYTFSWTFGDGVTSTNQNPRHTYTSTGLFNVVLTVTDSRQNRSTTSLVIQVGGAGVQAPGPASWFYEFVGASVLAAAIAGVWAAVLVRQRTRRREGEEWIKELTSLQEGANRPPPPNSGE